MVPDIGNEHVCEQANYRLFVCRGMRYKALLCDVPVVLLSETTSFKLYNHHQII